MSLSRLTLLCFLLFGSLGCQSLSKLKSFGPRDPITTSNRENPQDAESDPWIEDAGTVARSEHSAEAVNDPLKLRDVFMSNKARDIERNLGVGD